jgi:hypothetical protein
MNTSSFSSPVKLSLMMFFQYMMFAVWWVPLAAYLTNMGLGGIQKSLVLSSMAIGCMASPLIGMVADRFFEGQKVLATLNLISAVMLLLSGLTNSPDWLFIFLLLAMLFYMPTWSLTSSIALTHCQPEQFSRVRVFGSVGWVVSGVFSLVMVKLFNTHFDGTNIPFFFASSIGILAAICNFYLPATPSAGKGKSTSIIDVLGLRTIRLMKERILLFLSFSLFCQWSLSLCIGRIVPIFCWIANLNISA